MIQSLKAFIWKYLAGPIVADARNAETAVWETVTASTGYNPVNTVTWMVIASAVVYGAYLLFQQKGLSFDQKTAIYSTPYILLGGFLRFIEDSGFVNYPESVLLVTPLIYLVVAVPYLVVSVFSQPGNWERNLLYSGSLLVVPAALAALLEISSVSIGVFGAVMVISVLMTGLFYGLVRNTPYDNPAYLLAGFSQFFGGAASMMAVENGYVQKQLLAQFSTQLMGSPGILVTKTLVLVLALWTVNDMDDQQISGLIILGLLAIGLGTGLRVFLRLLAGI